MNKMTKTGTIESILEIVDILQDFQEPLVILFTIFWMERRLGKIRCLGDEVKQSLYAKPCETLSNVTEKVTIVNELDKLQEFTPTAFSFFNFDRRLILSFIGSVTTFTVLFINLSRGRA